MPWRHIGVPIAVIVAAIIVLGRVSSVVVDWAWLSTIGYVGVFWTVFATKAALFVVVFAAASLFLWVNGTLAFWLASRLRLRLPVPFDPGFATVRALPGPPPELFGLALPALTWRLLILAVAVVIGLLIAMGEVAKWDLILRFIYQVPYGQSDPLFDKDIGFYLFSLPVYVALKNWLLLVLVLTSVMAAAIYFVHGDINLNHLPWSVSSAAIAHGSALLGFLLRGKGLADRLGPTTCCSTTTTASWSVPATLMSMSNCRCSGCRSRLPARRCCRRMGQWLRLRTYRLVTAAAVSGVRQFVPFFRGVSLPSSNVSLSSQASCSPGDTWYIRVNIAPDAGSLQPPTDHCETTCRGTGPQSSVAAEQPRDRSTTFGCGTGSR